MPSITSPSSVGRRPGRAGLPARGAPTRTRGARLNAWPAAGLAWPAAGLAWPAAGLAWPAAGLATLLLSACAVGPDYVQPLPPPVTSYLPGSNGHADTKPPVAGLDIPGQWWRTFHSRALTSLVERAIRQNADLQAAQAALRAARETSLAQRGPLFPQVTTGYNTTGGKASADISPPLSNNSQYYSLTTAQVSVSYAPDLFGLNRRQIESTEALARAQRFQVEATYLTLTSNVVLAAVQEASVRAQIVATRKIIGIETDLLAILRRQLGAGQVANADVLVQEAALAAAQQTLPVLDKQLGVQRDLLTALAGQYSQDEITETFDLKALHLPGAPPSSLPSALVEHRPDVRMAEANLQSASALIGVAEANRLPVVSLSAEFGQNPSNLTRLFLPEEAFYTLAGNVAHTVFDGGTLLHRQKQSEAEFDQSYAQYRSAVIGAFQNVADALRAIGADARAEKAAQAAQAAAQRSLDISRQQLTLGAVGNIVLLNATQLFLQSELTLVQAQANRLTDTVALFQALGGGWWNRQDTPQQPAYSILDTIR